MWHAESSDLMFDICLTAATDNLTYRTNILKTRDRLLAESIHGNYYWSTGLSHKVTKQTLPDMFPGENMMGKILMKVRKELLLQEMNNKENQTDLKTQEKTSSQEIQVETEEIFLEQKSDHKTPSKSDTQKPQIQQKPQTLINLKRKSSETPPNDREDKKLATNATPVNDVDFNENTTLNESLYSFAQSDTVKTSLIQKLDNEQNFFD